ncbi:MAG: hypothetical protein ACRDQW_07245 [Haloechinothrix sp.]
MTGQGIPLNHRERATLRAVGQGRAEITCSCEPDLFIDGLACCDQFTARRLARYSLVVPLRSGLPGERVPALLTDDARAVLGLPSNVTADVAA